MVAYANGTETEGSSRAEQNNNLHKTLRKSTKIQIDVSQLAISTYVVF